MASRTIPFNSRPARVAGASRSKEGMTRKCILCLRARSTGAPPMQSVFVRLPQPCSCLSPHPGYKRGFRPCQNINMELFQLRVYIGDVKSNARRACKSISKEKMKGQEAQACFRYNITFPCEKKGIVTRNKRLKVIDHSTSKNETHSPVGDILVGDIFDSLSNMTLLSPLFRDDPTVTAGDPRSTILEFFGLARTTFTQPTTLISKCMIG